MVHPGCCAHSAAQPQPNPTELLGKPGTIQFPIPPALPHLYLDNFSTCFIYEDSPPFANTEFPLTVVWEAHLAFLFLLFLSSPCMAPGLQCVSQTLLLFGHGSRWGEQPQVGWAVIPPHPPHSTWLCLHLPKLSTWLGY